MGNSIGFLVVTKRSGHLHQFTPPCPQASEAPVELSAETGRKPEGCGAQDQAGSSLPFHLCSVASTVSGHSQPPLGEPSLLQSHGEQKMMN